MRMRTLTPRSGVFLGLSGITLAFILTWSWGTSRDSARASADSAIDRPFGLETRTPWTTSRLAGSPEPPPPYSVEPAFPKLKFDHPLALVSAKGTDRLFVAEQGGKILSFPNNPTCDKTDLVVDLAKHRRGLSALYGLTFHPDFARNRQVFICYVLKDGSPDGTRVSRFEIRRRENGPPEIDPESETILITWLGGGHNGGCLVFGPDGFLYISTGDGAGPSPPDPLHTGQDLADLLSSILRIDVDHPATSKPYTVPRDNPFVDLAGARPEIWAFGFRNPWKMSFDRGGKDLWVGDVGWELWELIFKVGRGGNYGWSVTEGRQPVHAEERRGPGPILPPMVDHPHSEAASITGGYVYRGTRLPDLTGAYVYGDYQTGRIWGLRHQDKKVTRHEVLADSPLQLVAFGEDNAGELYLLDYERTRQIHRLVANPAAGANVDFPRVLSKTGLFASTRDHTPAPGVIPYSINASLWADHAEADRMLALPGNSRVELDGQGNMKLPENTVLARTVRLELERGNPESRRRIETQILHKLEGSWRPYTYVWNEEQTDATLADAAGSSRTVTIRDDRAPGGVRQQAYRISARTECLLCHNPWIEQRMGMFGRQSASPLAFDFAQLNREHDYAGRADNQLRTLEHIGIFEGKAPRDPLRLADPYDPSADLNARARAYLHVNCSHCHQSNAGGTANLFVPRTLPLEETRTIGVRPIQGTFGISNARIIAPGDPEASVLYYRIGKLGGGRMPRLGSQVVDERALSLFHDWISSLPRSKDEPTTAEPRAKLVAELDSAQKTLRTGKASTPDANAQAIRLLMSSTRGGLLLMRMIDQGAISEHVRRQIVTIAKDHPGVEVRDLLERFVPEAERVARLGDVVNPADLLAMKGDEGRGKEVFFGTTAAQCKSCHQIKGVGESLGPDLSKVGAKYDRSALLQQILEPSRTIEPQYVTYMVETKSGRIHSGLIIARTGKEVVLKDARNQTVRVATADVEQLVPQSKSLMPELLLRDMTAQQVADLLEYLGSLK